METEKENLRLSEGDKEMEEFNLKLRNFFIKYDGLIKLFFFVVVILISILASIYIWDSYHIVNGFKQDPIGYCQELIAQVQINPFEN